jgi:hypothetical protein
MSNLLLLLRGLITRPRMSQADWISYGARHGYCTEVYCEIHDGVAREDYDLLDQRWNEHDGDHCWHVVRVKEL